MALELEGLLEVARGAALAGGNLAHESFGTSLKRERKLDGSWVTEADLAVETEVRRSIAKACPEHNILGEEEGLTAAGGGPPHPDAPTWIVDPIDGTNNFMSGIPIWATLVGLQVDGRSVLGVVHAPAIGETYDAATGLGARFNGAPISVAADVPLENAAFMFASVQSFYESGLDGFFEALVRRTWRSRGLGDFWAHMLVARGAAHIAVEPDLSLWDVAALQPIVEEAGGRLTRLRGDPFMERGSCISTNGTLHEEVLSLLEEFSSEWVETRLGRH